MGKNWVLIHLGTFGAFLISLLIKCKLGTIPFGYITNMFHWTLIAIANWALQLFGTSKIFHKKVELE